MKKILIEGINGSIELNDKYLYVIVNKGSNSLFDEHIVWFEEIEDIIYKKPTREKYGFISIYLSTKSWITNKKIKYTIMLNKIDEKSLETNKKVYYVIKSIISNKEIKVKEVVIKEENNIEENDVEENNIVNNTNEELNDIKKVDISFLVESNKEIKSNEQNDKKTVEIPNVILNKIEVNKKEELENKQEEKQKTIDNYEEIIDSVILNNKVDNNVKEDTFIENDNIILEDIDEEKIISDDDLINEDESKKELDEELAEEEQEEVINNEKIKSIDYLQRKIKELEKELQIITYKEIVISNHYEESNSREKIDKQIIELKKLIEKLEKIKKELLKHEKLLNSNDFLKINNGNVLITSYNRLLINDNKNELVDYIKEYKYVIDRIDSVSRETDVLSKEVDDKKKGINISDKDYEIEINKFRDVKSNKELINNYIKKTREDLSKVKWEIEKTVKPHIKYKYVKKAVSNQTKTLAALTALNSLRPKKSRFSMIALSFFFGTSALSDLFGYDIKKVEYNEIIQKEILVGLDSINTDKARFLINKSKDQIDKILYDCEKYYSEYPKFNELKKNLLSMKNDIEKEEKELDIIDDKIHDYKSGPMVKTLRYNQE